jgi:hydrogenase-4 membrane subunit HyfE
VKFWQTIRRLLSAAWIAEVAWPLRIVRGVLALYLVFGLTAAVVWLGLGRSAEKQVVDVAEGLSTIALIFLVPLFLFGLIIVPLHRWIGRKFAGFISTQDRDRPKS